MAELVEYLLSAIGATVAQLLLLVPGFVLALVHYYIAGAAKRQATRLFGLGFYYFTAIGVVLHELGHAALAVLFGHQLIDVKLFGVDPASGTAGYVRHVWDRRNLYQNMGNFFIGIGPLIFGAIAIYFAAAWLIGARILDPIRQVSVDPSALTSAGGFESFVRGLVFNAREVLAVLLRQENLRDWRFYVFLYLAFAIGSHMHLSIPDLAGMWSGFAALVLSVLVLNLLTLSIAGFSSRYVAFLSRTLSAFYGFMLLAIVLTAAFLALLTVISLVRAPARSYA